MFKLRHSDSICFRFCTKDSAPEKANSSSSTILPFGCGQIGLAGINEDLALTRQREKRIIPVASCIGGRAIRCEELGLSETGRDSGIFDASILVDWVLNRGQCMLKTGKSSFESGMTDERLVGER
jgi:hypothetical protein